MEKRKKKKRSEIDRQLHGLDLAMIFVAVFAVIFTVIMILLFIAFRSVPDTLIQWVYTAIGVECGAGAYIQTRKARLEDRKWALEDQKREKRERKRNERSILPDSADGGSYSGGSYSEVSDTVS